jgi:hypothetical protein
VIKTRSTNLGKNLGFPPPRLWIPIVTILDCTSSIDTWDYQFLRTKNRYRVLEGSSEEGEDG